MFKKTRILFISVFLIIFSCKNGSAEVADSNFNGDISKFTKLELDSSLSVLGRVVTKDLFNGVENKGPFYIQDDFSGLPVYFKNVSSDFINNVKIGMIVRFYGKKKEINQESVLEVDSMTYKTTDITGLNNKVIKFSEIDGNEAQYLRFNSSIEKVYLTNKDSIPERWESAEYRAFFNDSTEFSLGIIDKSKIAGEFVGTFKKQIKGILRKVANKYILYPTSMDDFLIVDFGITYGPEIIQKTINSVKIKFVTNLPSDYKLEYWKDGETAKTTIEKKSASSEHIVEITGLSTGTKYFYNLELTDHFIQKNTAKLSSASFITN